MRSAGRMLRCDRPAAVAEAYELGREVGATLTALGRLDAALLARLDPPVREAARRITPR